MLEKHEILMALLAFFSELIGTLSGVSSSTILVPMAQTLEALPVVLVTTAALHVIGNSIRIVIFRKEIKWKLSLQFGIPSILFAGLGAQLSDAFPTEYYSFLLGLFLILFSVYFLFFPQQKVFTGPYVSYLGGALSGFLTGLLGSGGAVRSLALVVFNLSPMGFIATSTLIDFGGDLLRLGIYIKKGYLDSSHLFYIPILMLTSLVANFIAKKLMPRIPQDKFKKIVLSFVFLMGVISLFNAIKESFF